MNSVAADMMATLMKGKTSPSKEQEEKKSEVSGFNQEMYNQSNQDYGDDEEDYYPEQEYGDEVKDLEEISKLNDQLITVHNSINDLPKTESELFHQKIKELEAQMLECSSSEYQTSIKHEPSIQEKHDAKKLEVQFENSVKADSEAKVRP